MVYASSRLNIKSLREASIYIPSQVLEEKVETLMSKARTVYLKGGPRHIQTHR